MYSFANNNARSLASTPVLHIYTTLSSSGSNKTNCFTNWVKRSDTNPWVVVNFEICDVAVETTCRVMTYFSSVFCFSSYLVKYSIWFLYLYLLYVTWGWAWPICADPFKQSRYSSPFSVNTYCRLALTTFKGSSDLEWLPDSISGMVSSTKPDKKSAQKRGLMK